MIPDYIKISNFLTDDRVCVSPDDGEEFYGVPSGWYKHIKESYIAVMKDNKLIGTINCKFIREINFEPKERSNH